MLIIVISIVYLILQFLFIQLHIVLYTSIEMHTIYAQL